MSSLPPFCLHRPDLLAEAFDALSTHADDASIVMGGTELFVLMKLGLSKPGHLVDCRRLPELAGIEDDGRSLRIGASATHTAIATHPTVAVRLPALRDLEQEIANRRVRNVGTLGGNLCFAEPHSDPATLLIALDAVAEIVSPRGRREVALEDFFRGPFLTALEAGEILTRVRVPFPEPGTNVRFQRLAFGERPVANLALVTGAAGIRVSVGAVGLVPVRVPEAEALLASGGAAALDEAGRLAAAAARPYEDLDGSSEFKSHLVGVLLRRAAAGILAGPQEPR